MEYSRENGGGWKLVDSSHSTKVQDTQGKMHRRGIVDVSVRHMMPKFASVLVDFSATGSKKPMISPRRLPTSSVDF